MRDQHARAEADARSPSRSGSETMRARIVEMQRRRDRRRRRPSGRAGRAARRRPPRRNAVAARREHCRRRRAAGRTRPLPSARPGGVDRLQIDQRRVARGVARHRARRRRRRRALRARRERRAPRAPSSRWISENEASPPRITRPSRARPSSSERAERIDRDDRARRRARCRRERCAGPRSRRADRARRSGSAPRTWNAELASLMPPPPRLSSIAPGAHAQRPVAARGQARDHGSPAPASRRARRGSANSSSMIALPVASSRLPVGSSAISSEGRGASARASATRCCSPPESWAG